MDRLTVHIAGEARPVDVVCGSDDLEAVRRDIDGCSGPMAVDVETTGLDIFAAGFGVRMVQLAVCERAWCFPIEGYAAVDQLLRDVLASRPMLLAHNASYDLMVLDRFGYVELGEAWSRMSDTRIMGHLLDPRSTADGAVGHKLEAMAAHYLGDEDLQRYEAELLEVFAAEGWKKNDGSGYRNIDLRSPVFHRYGAADVLQTCWLYEAIAPLVRARGFSNLAAFEHEVASVTCAMQRKGVAVDAGYAPELSEYLLGLRGPAEATAARFGVANVNSRVQLEEAFTLLGVDLVKKTATGKFAVDKEVLAGLSSKGGAVGELAEAVTVAKTAAGNEVKYVGKVMASLGADGRCHPSINSLQARTARMSISGPPLQQLPAGDWRIRRLFVASEGAVIGACDYSQIELRVMGALGGDRSIINAVRDGVDLHDLTASKLGVPRRLAKTSNFLAAYGGGYNALAAQAGIPLSTAKATLDDWWTSYSGVAKYAAKLQRRSDHGRKPVVTATGRELPLDRNRVYAALNYVVQSTARDIFCAGLLEVKAAGYLDNCLLPVHDEVVYEAAPADIDEVGRGIGEAMTAELMGMQFDATPETFGASWGHGYGYEEVTSE